MARARATSIDGAREINPPLLHSLTENGIELECTYDEITDYYKTASGEDAAADGGGVGGGLGAGGGVSYEEAYEDDDEFMEDGEDDGAGFGAGGFGEGGVSDGGGVGALSDASDFEDDPWGND